LVGGRPRKTAEELDAEMADYWGSKGGDDAAAASNGNGETTAAAGTSSGANGAAGDVDMDI
jgi:THO complex subunit 4